MAPHGKWIDNIGPESSIAEAARRSLDVRLSAVNYWLPLAAYLADQDVEHVHRLRVSTRRAAAALRLYRDWLPRKPSRWLKKRLRKVRRAAGDARDLDVLRQRLEREYGERRASTAVTLIAEKRKVVQPALVKIADRNRRRDRFVRKISKLINGIGRRNDRAGLSTRFGDWAISKLSGESMNFFNAMPDTTADTAALHQLRIRAKALRYTIELVAPAFGPELRDEYYPLVEEVQERLGAVQDHVAAAAHLRAWAAELEDSESHDTLRELAAEQDKRLDEVLGEFRAWWTAERADTLRRGLMSPHQAVAATPLRQAAGQT